MKPQQLARLLNIAPSTLRTWAGRDYAEFLSPSAAGINGAHRSFSDKDARVLAWVAMLRAQNTPIDDILATLRSAQANGWKNLPPLPGGIANDEPIAVVPREAVEERIRAIQEKYELQLQTVIKERDELKARLDASQQETKAALQDSLKIRERLAELAAEEAELRGKLDQYTFAGQRRNAATLIVISLLVGALLMGLVIVATLLVATQIVGQR